MTRTLAFVAVAAVSMAAQESRYTVPRTPWGDPDLQGLWPGTAMMGVPMERPPVSPGALGRGGPGPGIGIGPPGHWGERPSRTTRQTSFVVDPPDGRIPPVTAEARARAAGRDTGSFGAGPFNAPEDLTNFDRCITRSVVGSIFPRPYNNGLRIVQAPGFIAITHEMIHETRVIPLDGRPHLGSNIRMYMGDSRGRWENGTLVVDTTNLTDRTSIGFNGNGLRHSEAMRLVESFTRVDGDTIQYEVTIEDPKTYARPFKMAVPMTTQPGYQIFEYACHEGNYGMAGILAGARADETATAGGTNKQSK